MSLIFVGAIGVLLIFLFPGSPEQDVDYHFLMIRTAWVDHFYFVDVWSRPLFTTVFVPVALLGFTATRFLALIISLAVAWQTYRLACDLRLRRPWLAILFLIGQPTVFALFSNLFTELLFALLFVTALRCDIGGRKKIGMVIASFMPLARPEGVFLCLFWGLWILVQPDAGETNVPCPSSPTGVDYNPRTGRDVGQVWRVANRLSSTLLLAIGVLCWWFTALILTGDPLFILHNWPATWHQGMYGHGTFFSYAQGWRQFIGLALIVPFLFGWLGGFRSRHWVLITSSFLVLFLLHSIFMRYGLFGEAGFPRYMASVSPAVALLTLDGWNRIFSIERLRRLSMAAGCVMVTLSFLQGLWYLDSMAWGRDAVAINQMANWLKERDRAFPELIWSNGRMSIALGRNMRNSPPSMNRGNLIELLQKAPTGTIVFWDSEIGPNWFGMTVDEIEQRGYTLLADRQYTLQPLIYPAGRFSWFPGAGYVMSLPPRELELSLLEKR